MPFLFNWSWIDGEEKNTPRYLEIVYFVCFRNFPAIVPSIFNRLLILSPSLAKKFSNPAFERIYLRFSNDRVS